MKTKTKVRNATLKAAMYHRIRMAHEDDEDTGKTQNNSHGSQKICEEQSSRNDGIPRKRTANQKRSSSENEKKLPTENSVDRIEFDMEDSIQEPSKKRSKRSHRSLSDSVLKSNDTTKQLRQQPARSINEEEWNNTEIFEKIYEKDPNYLWYMLQLEKLFRNGDLLLTSNANCTVTKYVKAVQSRLQAYDNVPYRPMDQQFEKQESTQNQQAKPPQNGLRFSNESIAKFQTNPRISISELEVPGKDGIIAIVNSPFEKGTNTNAAKIVMDEKLTRNLWEELQEPYGNQLFFFRHLTKLEKYFRNGDLLASNATEKDNRQAVGNESAHQRSTDVSEQHFTQEQRRIRTQKQSKLNQFEVQKQQIILDKSCRLQTPSFNVDTSTLNSLASRYHSPWPENQQSNLTSKNLQDLESFQELTSKKSLQTHERLYKCGECGNRYKSKQYLIVHMRVHTGERPYECEDCGKKFIGRTNLNIHMRNHCRRR